jgi:uncharacterized damage-inducible protein DinB
MKDWLIEAFSYDEWANEKWLAALRRQADHSKGRRVLEHILNSQRVWLDRCGYGTPAADLPIEERIVLLPTAWREFLAQVDITRVVEYKSFSGEPFAQPIRDIALHVINHGTYHRGHLRGLADAQGIEDFEDTDLIRYLRLRGDQLRP